MNVTPKTMFGRVSVRPVLGTCGLPLLALSAVLANPLAAHGQSFYGSIVGVVTDSTGAVVPDVSVVVKNLNTGDTRTVQAGKDGSYRVSNLPPGQYQEDIELPGFKHFTRQPILVEVGTADKIDVAMELGQTSETVTVTSSTPLLQTDSASLGQVIEPQTVQEEPLNGRNVINLIALAPGVVAQGGTSGPGGANGGTGSTNPQGFNNFQIGGGLPGQSATFYDGAPVNGLGANYIQLIMSQDAVEEFQVATNSPSAEFGRFGGGVINFTTKTGGNKFHGTAYEYFRNTVLNAGSYFSKLAGQPKPPVQLNQFGGSIGGPILKDKAFFFLNYEQFKYVKGQTATTNVPTAAERMGDFSADSTIYDPLTTVVTNGVVTRQKFTGNMIPMARIDPTANEIANVLQYYPLPNATIVGANYAATRTPGTVSKQPSGRLDYTVSQKQHIFARYTYWSVSDFPLNTFHNITSNSVPNLRQQDGVIGDTYSFSPVTTLDVRLSVLRGYQTDKNQNAPQPLSEFGPAWATLQNQVTYPELIEPVVTGFFAFTGMPNISQQYRDVVAFAPSISTVKGKHVIKVGADLRFLDFNYINTGAVGASGQFQFNSSFTSSNATTTSGNAFASFLLGYPSSGVIDTFKATGQYNYYQGYYVNDTWQATPKVTLNLGLRYELPGGFMERHNLATVLQPNGASALGSNYHGSLALVNSATSAGRATEQAKHDLFAPRLGVSYSPTTNTVVHAAYGITYLPFDVYEGAAPTLSPINTAVNTIVSSVNNAGRVPLNTLSNPFPQGGVTGTVQQSIQQPAGRSQAYLDSLNGLSISGPVANVRFGYDQQWSVSVQQQLLGGSLFQLAYAGNRGTFLPQGASAVVGSTNNLNQLPDQYLSMGAALLTTVANPLAGQVNAAGALNGATVTAGQLLRPYPQYTNVLQTNAKGDAIYHSLQVSFIKRLPRGGVLSSNYTWSKNIGNVPANLSVDGGTGTGIGSNLQDFTNPRGDRSLLNFDVPHRFVTSAVLPLPFGHDQLFLTHASPFVEGLVSGFELNTIVTLQSGFPLSYVASNNALATSFGAGVIRPNVVNGCNLQISASTQQRRTQWFNTACFTAPGNFSFGNETRVDGRVRAAGVANYDLSVVKTTGVSEHLKVQLRTEFFNLFNRTQFAPPATLFGSSTFGTVTAIAPGSNSRQIQVALRLLF